MTSARRPVGVAVIGMGARGHLGLSALQIGTAARALALEPGGTPFIDTLGQEAGLATASCIGADKLGFDRYVALAAPALREAAHGEKSPLPLFVALPEAERPDQAEDPRFGAPLVEALAQAADVAIDLDASEVVRAGHAGFAFALSRARQKLGEHPRGAYVGGVDSPFHQGVVRWLDERDHFMRLEGVQGRIPAEAAAFLRIRLEPEGARAKARSWIRAITSDVEPDGATPGVTLGRLVRRVARAPRKGGLDWVLSDVNGEEPRTLAWLGTESEANDLLEQTIHDDLVQHTGDTGAATGALLAVIALVWAKTGSARAENVLVATSADGRERGVFVMDLETPSGRFTASAEDARVHELGAAPGARRPSLEEQKQMERFVRGRLEDIGSMSILLAPGPATDVAPEAHAARLLESFDALAAVGVGVAGAVYEPDLGAIVERYLAEATSPDPPRRFATSFFESHTRRKRRRT